ncbi:hypothetical protein [Streptomyces sp. NPDC056191]|uniref:hypothetical protein n=1 Tax=unclassified Streptomyces TaxID=2593676 RepID=UPI0035DD077C
MLVEVRTALAARARAASLMAVPSWLVSWSAQARMSSALNCQTRLPMYANQDWSYGARPGR